MSRIRHLTWAAVVLVVLVSAPTAAASYRQAIRDCATDGQLHRLYPQAQLEQALAHLPTDVAWYTDCERVLREALLGGDGSGNPSGGTLVTTDPSLVTPSGAVAGSHQDLAALDAQLSRHARPTAVIGGHALSPGAGGTFRVGSSSTEGTPPLAVVLALIALAAFALLALILSIPRSVSQTRRIALQTRRVALQLIRR